MLLHFVLHLLICADVELCWFAVTADLAVDFFNFLQLNNCFFFPLFLVFFLIVFANLLNDDTHDNKNGFCLVQRMELVTSRALPCIYI